MPEIHKDLYQNRLPAADEPRLNIKPDPDGEAIRRHFNPKPEEVGPPFLNPKPVRSEIALNFEPKIASPEPRIDIPSPPPAPGHEVGDPGKKPFLNPVIDLKIS